jgi:bifunctional DNA-binding transcriptional regulator/antitoxin component of YhaV-PrlF toxin-antitoxin module
VFISFLDGILNVSEFQIDSVLRKRGGLFLFMATKLVEFLTTTRIGERGTMTLPKDYRDALQIETGAVVTVLRIGNGLMLIPEQKRFDELCDSIAAKLENAGATEGALQATLPEVRDRLTRKRYPELFSQKASKKASRKK